MNSQRGLQGLQRGPSALRVWPAFAGLRPLTLSAMLPFQATVQMEGGKVVVEFPNYHQTSEIVGGKLVEVSVLLDPGRTGVFFCLRPGPLSGRLPERLAL